EVYTGQGFNIQGGYVFKNNWEVASRFTTIVPDNTFSSNETENQYTLGASKYIVGHKLKFQTDLSYTTVRGESHALEYRLGFDLHF
ncbi:MAG TPA: porin, partial [Aequorivita sp.]|nr:porin [Aequorivita sp.]